MDLLHGQGPVGSGTSCSTSAGRSLGAVRIDDFKFQFFQQPQGWPGPKVTTDMPIMVNIRQDPFERTPSIGGQSTERPGRRLHERFLSPASSGGSSLVQQQVAKLADDGHRLSADAGPGVVQPGCGEDKIEEMIKEHEGQ